jgi:hypothetical protein
VKRHPLILHMTGRDSTKKMKALGDCAVGFTITGSERLVDITITSNGDIQLLVKRHGQPTETINVGRISDNGAYVEMPS